MTKRHGANHLRPTFVPSGMKTPIPWRAAVLFLLVSSAVLVTFAAWGDAIDAWTRATVEKAGGDRVLVAAVLFLVLASDILLPVPSSLASTSCGLFLGLWTGFAVSFAAMSASAAAGYALGRFCSDRAARLVGASDMAALRSFQRRFGPWLLLAMRPVPVLAEASAVFAGIGRMPVESRRFNWRSGTRSFRCSTRPSAPAFQTWKAPRGGRFSRRRRFPASSSPSAVH